PETDMAYEGIDSKILLKKVMTLIEERGYKIINIDSIIVAQRPKLKPYLNQMREILSEILNVDIDQLSIKATTEEKLGFTGSEEGIKSYAVVLLEK
ncbi:MAG: 2-C-methyl-D-erythritol 2,4-cyclodiphosphate synthase, partial [Cetobacterium sp.]|nr:2-C-methyl-D-erythritol 2,4-cyclodiphosphate synthase [Cetobacterium sp.]